MAGIDRSLNPHHELGVLAERRVEDMATISDAKVQMSGRVVTEFAGAGIVRISQPQKLDTELPALVADMRDKAIEHVREVKSRLQEPRET